MGKPFGGELSLLKKTVDWTNKLDLDHLKTYLGKLPSPIYVVGSGGSLSACHYAVSLFNDHGKFARAVTPLELFFSEKTIRNSSILFITASGKNYDIKFSFKRALEYEPKAIGAITMKENNPLSLLTQKHGIAETFDFTIPSGKDGFLATNSLIAFFSILNKTLGVPSFKIQNTTKDLTVRISRFLDEIANDCTLVILHGGWNKAVAVDIESKCTEAGLTTTLIADYRNFGHGRHHWFDKNPNSAIIALANKTEINLCHKTLKTLPNSIPKLVLESASENSDSALYILIQSFEFIKELGLKVGIDPGRPGVPGYGRKLYHLPYSNLIKPSKKTALTKRAELSIKRKLNIDDLQSIDKKELEIWRKSYSKFMGNLLRTSFGMVLFDYDGTICSSKERFTGPSNEMAEKLLSILENGFMFGVVTGRGKSIRNDLQKIIPKKYWEQVLVGYYNGSEFGALSDDSLPDKGQELHPSLQPIIPLLSEIETLYGIKVTKRPNQLTIEIEDNKRWGFIRNLVIQTIKTSGLNEIQILESSHSMDIIPNSISKVDMVPSAKEKLKERNLPEQILYIGDKGQWSGNDFMLLDNEFGLSVDDVSSKLDTCWNIASLSNRNSSATLEYLDCLVFSGNGIGFKISK
jgi:hydroxymethylpyrimidine pyrophosphatase-like HAD family hydrolase